MLIVRTNKRYFSCVVGGDFHPHFHASLDIKIAKCTILKTGSDLTALFSSAPQKHKKICRFTASVQALQHFLACLQNSNFCSRCCSNLFTLVIDTEFASLEIVGDFLISLTEQGLPWGMALLLWGFVCSVTCQGLGNKDWYLWRSYTMACALWGRSQAKCICSLSMFVGRQRCPGTLRSQKHDFLSDYLCYFCNYPEEYFSAAFSNATFSSIPEKKQTN